MLLCGKRQLSTECICYCRWCGCGKNSSVQGMFVNINIVRSCMLKVLSVLYRVYLSICLMYLFCKTAAVGTKSLQVPVLVHRCTTVLSHRFRSWSSLLSAILLRVVRSVSDPAPMLTFYQFGRWCTLGSTVWCSFVSPWWAQHLIQLLFQHCIGITDWVPRVALSVVP